MTTPKAGGFGAELFGDPMGAGGPLFVVRARAIAGQVVRVVFDEEPIHRAASGLNDALNPQNYTFTCPDGNATAPAAMGVDTTMVVGPAIAVGNGSAAGVADERGFDVHVDRPFIVGVNYVVTVSNVISKLGGALGTPHAAGFGGLVKLHVTRLPPKKTDLVDIFNDPFTGAFKVDDSGDLAIQSGRDGFRKRVLRRIITPKNAYAFLPGYGVGVKLKQVASLAQVSALKTDIIRQVLQEPEAASVDATTTLDATGVLTINLNIKTKVGAFVTVGMQASPDGSIMVL